MGGHGLARYGQKEMKRRRRLADLGDVGAHPSDDSYEVLLMYPRGVVKISYSVHAGACRRASKKAPFHERDGAESCLAGGSGVG